MQAARTLLILLVATFAATGCSVTTKVSIQADGLASAVIVAKRIDAKFETTLARHERK